MTNVRRFFPFWFVTLLITLVVCAIVWFFGPRLSLLGVKPLDMAVVRMLVVMVLLMVWATLNIVHLSRRARNAEAKNEEEEEEEKPEVNSNELAKSEAALVTTKVEKILSILKTTSVDGKPGRRVIYQLPWYLLIGPEGSGKTSCLLRSGMKFPLAHKLGQNVDGATAEPTPECEYWFSNHAIIVDSAGRYTSQDQDGPVDSAGWQTLLSLIKRTRRRQPLNGMIIAVNLAKLATLQSDKRLDMARTLKQRIKEAEKQLGLRFPIYVMFTKLDLIAGFTDYFHFMGREERQQVWGITFPLDDVKSSKNAAGYFSSEYELLIERLNSRNYDYLSKETDIQHRGLIYGFPQQMLALKTVLNDFLTEMFRPNRYEDRSLLRGVYFTSAIQMGQPVDLLAGPLAQAYGVGQQAIPSAPPDKHAFFLERLFFDLIFGESNLAGENKQVMRKRKIRKRLALSACAIILAFLTTVWVISYQLNRENIIHRAQADLEEYPKFAERIDSVRVNDSNYLAVLPILNYLRDLPGGYAEQHQTPARNERWGLNQIPQVAKDADALYHNGLERYLRPRMMLRLEQQMVANISNPEFLFEALRIYLELAEKGPLEPATIQRWEEVDWGRLYSDPRQITEREQLSNHLAVLLAKPFLVRIDVNTELVSQVREILNATPITELAYSYIKAGQAAQNLPEWRPDEAGGSATTRVFSRFSGKPLSDGIAGLYTYDGFHGVFLPQLVDSIQSFVRESWVLGPNGQLENNEQTVTRIERGVLGLYLDDYARMWDAMLADLKIVKFSSLSQATDVINTASGPNSPIRSILVSVAEQTQLTKTYTPSDATGIAQNVAGGAARIAQEEARATTNLRQQQLVEVLGESVPTSEGGPKAVPPGTSVATRFEAIDSFTLGTGSGATPLDGLLTRVTDLYRELNRILLASNSQQDALSYILGGGSDAVKTLKDEAPNLPMPLQSWVLEMLQFSSQVTLNNAQNAINAAWSSEVLPLCSTALPNRYPVAQGQQASVMLDDFSTLFKPGGKIETFFKANLKSFVNTSSTPWTWREPGSTNNPASKQALQVFEKADTIQNAYFGQGGDQPSVSFTMTPVDLDIGSTRVALNVDGTTVSYAHGPTRPVELNWPGTGVPSASIAFFPAIAGKPNSINLNGPWALFRLLEKASVTKTKIPDQYKVRFTLENRFATFNLVANSVNNPFSAKLLQNFTCRRSVVPQLSKVNNARKY
ncbi:hypothetical protein PsAD2_03870 [Pseudovibrio axinellae]|uniref:Intracellular multiplication and macrophage-killing protein n=1 Tax=Pseudovibrio axinellae TaxID=989403 RepID=A0A165UMK9_9HYPH|nr:type VI secretion system membrane subunit TssM [Pseudovibrio axinellae]KZL12564.1 hypothetical protein PsAD2_03870 [Pseudovibrio axinellae]SEP66666.1 type VI secretion system protein ImpL [Pseudovibrio axinellae]